MTAVGLFTPLGSTQSADAEDEAWVRATLASMSLDQRIGQLVVPSFESDFGSTDSDRFDELMRLVRDQHVGGIHVFGARQAVPEVRLNPTYARVVLGDPLAAGATLNRLQQAAQVPLLVTADFESGVGFRMKGATLFPRAMAFGAAGDERLAFEAGRITAIEGRAVGVHVNFAPVVDVNNNPRNPVINTRSFGEDPALVSRMAVAYIRGLRQGGMLSSAKHFPGHGDTDVDTHLGLARISHDRRRWERVEWAPFRASIEAGVDALMTGHIEIPALHPGDPVPATLSQTAVEGFLRREVGFEGLIYTDSMSMAAVANLMDPGEAAVQAIVAGNDVVLHSPDPVAAIAAIRSAVDAGRVSESRLAASVERVLRAKARVGLDRERRVDLDEMPARVGGRLHAGAASEVAERGLTLLRDQRGDVPLGIAPDGSLLYLSVLDYPSNWGTGAPSRAIIPELQKRWPRVTAIEVSDQTGASDLQSVGAEADRYDAIVLGVFVRTASGSGRMDLAEPVTALLEALAVKVSGSGQPLVAVLFGNPYVAMALPRIPAVILAFDSSDHAEVAAARALAGETPIGGRLPISLPGLGAVGFGLTRPAASASIR